MAADPGSPQDLAALAGGRRAPGDLPDALGRRYFVERGREVWRLYRDALSPTPAIEDRGDRLRARRADPGLVHDMAAIAAHRGWTGIEVRGDPDFRREAWLAGRALGLEVRGHRPGELDLQALARRPAGQRDDPAAAERLQIAEAIIRDRIADPAARARLVDRARARVAEWLARGARFAPMAARDALDPEPRAPGRDRSRDRNREA